MRNAGEQGRHAGDVAVVFAGLVGASEEGVVDGGEVEVGVAGGEGAQGVGREVVGAYGAKAAAEAANGGSDSVD